MAAGASDKWKLLIKKSIRVRWSVYCLSVHCSQEVAALWGLWAGRRGGLRDSPICLVGYVYMCMIMCMQMYMCMRDCDIPSRILPIVTVDIWGRGDLDIVLSIYALVHLPDYECV